MLEAVEALRDELVPARRPQPRRRKRRPAGPACPACPELPPAPEWYKAPLFWAGLAVGLLLAWVLSLARRVEAAVSDVVERKRSREVRIFGEPLRLGP